ncbi:MAG: peptidylprolyl isomerase [Acidobacteriaceae bacterium]|nr:peptidylprolyl isomerase [Acidobacteriaceae bacterium]
MIRSLPLIVFLSCGVLLCAQSTTPPTTTVPSKTAPASTPSTPHTQAPANPSASPATGQLKVRGPEAVAQQDPNKIVATIDGRPITAREAITILKQLPDDQRNSAPSLSNLLEQIYILDRFSDQAEKLKLDEQSPWKERLQLQRKQVLAQAYVTDLGKGTTPAGAGAQQYYNSHSADFEQIKLSGILVAFNGPGTPASGAQATRTEAEAQAKANELEKKIKDGGDFSALARTDSDQQASAVRGGELGTFMINDPKLPPEVKSVVEKLQTGQVSEPVRLPGGFFIFKVASRTKVPFDQARPGIVQKLEVDKYKIQVQDPDFFASSAPASNIPSLQRPAPAGQTPPPASPPKPPGQ